MKIGLRQKVCFCISILCFTVLLAGCATTWVTEAQGIIGALVPSIVGILSLIGALSGRMTDTDIALVTKGSNEAMNDLNNVVLPLINSYNAAAAADQGGILQRIKDAIDVVIENWNSVLGAVHVSDPATKVKIEAVAGLVEAELTSLLNLIPVLKAAGPKATFEEIIKALRASGNEMPLNAGQYKHAFNRAMTAKTGDPAIDSITGKLVIP